MASVSLRSRCALAVAGVLLLGAGAGRSQVQRLEPHEGRSAQLISALSRLAPAERSQYLQAQQGFERQRSAQRLAQLDQAQRCLARAADEPSLQRCWRALLSDGHQLRRQEKEQQSQLAQRFGLPQPFRPLEAAPASGSGSGRW